MFASNFHKILYHLIVASLWLADSGRAGDPEAWSLQLVAIDHDPGTMSSPAIAHDL